MELKQRIAKVIRHIEENQEIGISSDLLLREIDHLVAEVVMVLPDVRIQERGEFKGALIYGPSLGQWHHGEDVLHYSTDIAAAWEVVTKKRLLDGSVLTFIEEWKCWYVGGPPSDDAGYYGTDGVRGKTVPLAICLAALKAVGK